MLSEHVYTFEEQEVAAVFCNGLPFLRAADVTAALGYKNSAKTIRAHVDRDQWVIGERYWFRANGLLPLLG